MSISGGSYRMSFLTSMKMDYEVKELFLMNDKHELTRTAENEAKIYNAKTTHTDEEEAAYNARLKEINDAEKEMDLLILEFETELKMITTEFESIKKMTDDSIKNVFKGNA